MNRPNIPTMPVTLVCGAPGAGKTTFVKEKMKRGDLLIDLDMIFSALTGLDHHDNPQSLLGIAIEARNAVLMRASLMGADRPRTWIIACAPSRRERQFYKGLFPNLSVVIIDTPAVVCLERIGKDPMRAGRWAHFKNIVEKWFDSFEGEAGDEKEEWTA